MSSLPNGTVRISPKVASGNVGGEFVVMDVATDQVVVLYENARPIWTALQAGNVEIDTLVEAHAKRTGVIDSTAASQVLTFLWELRSLGFLEYSLEKEREAAPLMDTIVGGPRVAGDGVELTLRQECDANVISGLTPETPLFDLVTSPSRFASPQGDSSADSFAVFVKDRENLYVRDLSSISKISSSVGNHAISRLIVVEGSVPDLAIDELASFSDAELRRATSTITDVIDEPDPDLSLISLRKPAPGARRGSIIVIACICKNGKCRCIGVIIRLPGPGPTWGKSRSACKTVCV